MLLADVVLRAIRQGVPATKKYKVTLTDEERTELPESISRGKGPGWLDVAISEDLV